MADINQTDVEFNVNNEKAKTRLDEIKKKLNELEIAWAKVAATGDKETRDKINKRLQETKRELRQLESGTAAVERVFKQLNKATPTDLNKALKHLQSELKTIERGTPAWDAHVQKIRKVKAELDKVNAEMRQSESLLVRMKNKVNDWGAMAAGGAAAMTGLVMAGKKAVQSYAEMEQEMANVRKYTGMTAEEVEHLNEAFKKMDTRTSREGLNQLAQEAGRLGMQSEEDVLGFVKAADKINVALDDLGEGATLTLSKLTDIFGDKQRLGVEQSLLSVGSVINELSQNSTASAPYLAEFAQRLAGVGAQAQMSIPEIMGFGAVLDSQGQKLEMSSTALSKVIMNMFKDPAKIAEATGLSIEKFSETCKRSTNEGLLMLLERLNELGGIDSLAPVFADMGENGARASAVLAALAGNVDQVRKQQEAANVAFQEATSIDKEFNVQNTTVQAGLEKAKKRFNEMAVELGQKLLPVMKYFHSSMSYVMKIMSATIDVVKKYRIEILGAAAAVATYYAIMKAKDVWNSFVSGCKKAIAAVKSFNKALLANPYAAVAALIVGIGIALAGYIRRSREAARAADEHRMALERQQEAEKRTADSLGELMAKYKMLQQEWKKLSTEHEKRDWIEKNKESFEQLGIKVNSVLDADNAFINNTEKYINALKARAKANALQGLYEESISNMYSSAKEEAEKLRPGMYTEGAHISSKSREAGILGKKASAMSGRNGGNTIFKLSAEDAERLNAYYDNLVKEEETRLLAVKQKGVDDIEALYLSATAEAKSATDALNEVTTTTTGGGKESTWGSKDELDVWKKKQEAVQKGKLAQMEIDEEEYNRAMLELEVEYQAGLMSVLMKGSADYLAANAARLEAKKKLEENDEAASFARKKVQAQIDYLQGTTSHKEYTKAMLQLDVEEKEARMNRQKEGSAAYLQAQAAYLEAKKKLEDDDRKRSLREEDERYQDERRVLNENYAKGELSAKAYRLATEKAELDHLKNIVNAYEEGSEERLKAEKAYTEKSLAIQQKHAQETKKAQDDIRKSYFKYEGGNSNPEGMAEEKAQLEIVRMQLLAAATSAEQRLRIEQSYQEARYAIAKKYNDMAEMEAVDSGKAAVDRIAEYLKSEGYQKFTQTFSTLVNGMGEIFSGLSSLIDAETSLQEARINKKYEAELKAAEGNAAETERIEAEKEKEIAAMKNEAEEKKYGMQIASTIAQTAISAVNAYSSAAAIPVVGWIMGPIAAAMAVAAGGIQLATLKKQHEAAMSQGYAAGGYTMPGSKYQPAGIVHAGEWVASQDLLANPTAAATIAQLDKAQKTNTIGMLDRQQVSASVSAPVAVAQAKRSEQSQPDRSSETIDRLNKTLDNGIYAATTMTGDKGIQRQQRKYDQLMRNKGKK